MKSMVTDIVDLEGVAAAFAALPKPRTPTGGPGASVTGPTHSRRRT